MHVLIIGAGLCGLTLANGLVKHIADPDLHITLFERHSGPTHKLAGYGLHFGADGTRALRYCTSEETFERFIAGTTAVGTEWAFRDHRGEIIAVRDDAKISGRPAEEVEKRAAHRGEARAVLLGALRDERVTVVWGKSFSKYEELENGKVAAYFEDGHRVEGDVLVGADGSNSKVRLQRLPGVEREDLGMCAICGRYQLNEERKAALPQYMTDGTLNNHVPYRTGWLFISAFAEGGEWYTLWAYVLPKAKTPKDARTLTPEQLRDMALEGVKGWAPDIERIVREVDLASMVPLRLRSMPHLNPWKASRVTLLGDAIHNMTPMASVGGNIALRDAMVLTKAFERAIRGEVGVIEAIAQYENEMRPYANAAVALSRQIAEGATSMSLLGRLAFHALLRAARASPAVMRATIGKGALEYEY